MHSTVRKVEGNAGSYKERRATLAAACTICSPDYFPQAVASIESAKKYNPDCAYYILVISTDDTAAQQQPEISVLNLSDVNTCGANTAIIEKYSGDYLRWALKPVLISHLFKSHDIVAYLDCDLYFVSDWSWILNHAETHDMVLTPHRRPHDSRYMWTDGVYQAGFLVANKTSASAIASWKAMCTWNCTKDYTNGLFVDQKYLDAMPSLCKCHVLQSKGCNTAGWNTGMCHISKKDDGIYIDGWKLCFLHLSPSAEELPKALIPYASAFKRQVSMAKKRLEKSGAVFETMVVLAVNNNGKYSLVSDKLIYESSAPKHIEAMRSNFPHGTVIVPVPVRRSTL